MNKTEELKQIKAKDYYKGRTPKEVKEAMKIEGNQKSCQFQEWWDVFQFQSIGRRTGMCEMEMHSILSNRFELKRKPNSNE